MSEETAAPHKEVETIRECGAAISVFTAGIEYFDKGIELFRELVNMKTLSVLVG